MTLTDAQRKSGLLVISREQNSAYQQSSSRSIPYVEIYSQRTGTMETPAEHLQRAGEDEARRERATRGAQ